MISFVPSENNITKCEGCGGRGVTGGADFCESCRFSPLNSQVSLVDWSWHFPAVSILIFATRMCEARSLSLPPYGKFLFTVVHAMCKLCRRGPPPQKKERSMMWRRPPLISSSIMHGDLPLESVCKDLHSGAPIASEAFPPSLIFGAIVLYP